MDTDIQVSILCTAYNQVDYIEQAIQGFLRQKTTFNFEVLIHDDASMDGTAEIIKKYQQIFPKKIRCIFQQQNQFSKGVSVTKNLFKIARGKYIALCEGDDFWIDDNKLQIQFDFLESHRDYSLCVHSGYNAYADGKLMTGLFRPFKSNQTVDLIEIMENWLFPTASIFYRKELRDPYDIPFAYGAPCGDYPLVVFLSTKGKVFYFDKTMCVYRRLAKYSLSKEFGSNKDKQLEFNDRFIEMIYKLNDYTEHKYELLLMRQVSKYQYSNYLIDRDMKALLKNDYFNSLSIFNKYKNIFSCSFPRIYNILILVKMKIVYIRNSINRVYSPEPFDKFIESVS